MNQQNAPQPQQLVYLVPIGMHIETCEYLLSLSGVEVRGAHKLLAQLQSIQPVDLNQLRIDALEQARQQIQAETESSQTVADAMGDPRERAAAKDAAPNGKAK